MVIHYMTPLDIWSINEILFFILWVYKVYITMLEREMKFLSVHQHNFSVSNGENLCINTLCLQIFIKFIFIVMV